MGLPKILAKKLTTVKNKKAAPTNTPIQYKLLEEEFELIDALFNMSKKSGLTQDELAEKMGTQNSNISRLKKGNANPSWKTLQKYAHACGFDISMKLKRAGR